MSFTEIEAELKNLTPEELRHLALKSWTAFVEKEPASNQCSEENPQLLAALDEAIEKAGPNSRAHSASEVRAQLKQWTSK